MIAGLHVVLICYNLTTVEAVAGDTLVTPAFGLFPAENSVSETNSEIMGVVCQELSYSACAESSACTLSTKDDSYTSPVCRLALDQCEIFFRQSSGTKDQCESRSTIRSSHRKQIVRRKRPRYRRLTFTSTSARCKNRDQKKVHWGRGMLKHHQLLLCGFGSPPTNTSMNKRRNMGAIYAHQNLFWLNAKRFAQHSSTDGRRL